jgi:hypothetical protein
MEHRRDVLVPESASRPGFAQKTLSGGVASKVDRVDDLQGDRAVQMSVIGFVSDTHGTPAQFPQLAVGSLKYFIMFVPVILWHCSPRSLVKQTRQATTSDIALYEHENSGSAKNFIAYRHHTMAIFRENRK